MTLVLKKLLHILLAVGLFGIPPVEAVQFGAGTGTAYPSGLDTTRTYTNVGAVPCDPTLDSTLVCSELINDLQSATRAIEVELGIDPSGAYATVKDRLDAIVSGAGDVVGPSVSVDNGIVRYDGTTGKLVQSYTSNTPTCSDTGVCTFVAPILGTPTSGTLTNAIGLPAAGVVGTALVNAAIGTTVQAFDADLTTWAGVTPGTGVATALGVNVGSAGSFVVNGGALGTPSSGTGTNITGIPAANILAGTFGTGAYTIKGTTTTDLPTYGSELLTSAGWTVTAGWTESPNDVFTHTVGTTTISHSATIANTTKHQISWTVASRTTGSFTISVGGVSLAAVTATGSWGPTTASTAAFTITPTTDFNGAISLTSLKQITAISNPVINLLDSAGASRYDIRANAGSNNTGVGLNSSVYNTTGANNTGVGTQALYNTTTGDNNSGVGKDALLSNTTGDNNSALGLSSLYNITSGINNSALGAFAGRYIADGATANQTSTSSVYFGYNSRANADGDTNEIAVGFNAIGNGSNTATLGNSSITTTVLRSKVGIGIVAPTTLLHLFGADNTTVQTIEINATSANVTTADTFIDFRSSAGSIGSIAGTATAGLVAYNTFTGSHYTQVDEADRAELKIGMLLEATGDLLVPFTKKFHTRTIPEKVTLETGVIIPAHDIVEEFQASTPIHLVRSRISRTKGSQAAYGVYGGMDKEGRDMVLALGTGLCMITKTSGPLAIGDYLIASDVPGAMERQTTDVYRNSTVAKVMRNIAWEPGETVRRDVPCIYLGG